MTARPDAWRWRILIHGDAAFPGQGIVAETLNLQALDGYSTGGTLHVIANNQIGFTTDPDEERSTRYSSDIAKGYDEPIIHVNADDPEAAISAIRLAMAYRESSAATWSSTSSATGASATTRATSRPTRSRSCTSGSRTTRPPASCTRRRWPRPASSPGRGVRGGRRARARRHARGARRTSARQSQTGGRQAQRERRPGRAERRGARDRAPARAARELNEQLLDGPGGLHRPPEADEAARAAARHARPRRRDRLGAGRGASRSGASSTEGVPVRLTGQDTERGTFAHRHLVLHDVKTGDTCAPIQHLPGAQAPLERLQLAALRGRAASASSTATRSRARRRSSSGRRSSATS